MRTWFWWEHVKKGRIWKLRRGREDVQVAGEGVDLIGLAQNRGRWANY